jgi:hypothetical protein
MTDETTSLRECLQGIYERYQELTPELVLDEARDTSHPLHSKFEWDDSIAAEAHRREQARHLIRTVKVSFVKADGGTGTVRQYHAVRRNDSPRRSYRKVEELATDDLARMVLLQEMKRDYQRMKERYGSFKEFHEMIAADASAKAS